MRRPSPRSWIAAGTVGAALALLAGCGAPGAGSGSGSSGSKAVTPKKPGSPITLTVIDGAGNLVGTKPLFESFKAAHPDLVAKINYESAAAPDVAGKIKAQQLGKKAGISMVLGGPDVLGSVQAQHLVLRQLPDHKASLPDPATVFDEPRATLQNLSGGYGLINRYNPSGPLLEYNPSTVPSPPASPAALLTWAQAHPGKFTYAQPANSGPGRTFMMALPYLLGDTNPADPANGWAKTWAYLAKLGKYVTSYPASSTIAGQQFAAGQVLLTPTITGIDINNRQNGTWPLTDKVSIFDNQYWITDGHFMMIPNGVSAETLYVDLALESYILRPDSQLTAMAAGGSLSAANKNVTIDQLPADAKAKLTKYGRLDYYPKALATGKTVAPLRPDALQDAFDLWQRKIGSKVGG